MTEEIAEAAAAGEGQVFQSRHAAEKLTGCRVRWRDEEGAQAVMPTPSRIPTSIGHFGLLADVVCAQSVVAGLSPQRSVRTIGLAVHMLRPVRPGTLVEAHGERRLLDDNTGLSQVEMTVAGDRLVAVAVGRFLVLHEPHDVATLDAVEDESVLTPATTWDDAFGLAPQGPDELLATPTIDAGNTVGSLHGGMHTRLVDLAVQHWLGEQGLSQARLSDLAVTYHRAGPADGSTSLRLRVQEIRRGRRLIEVRVLVEDAQGKLISNGDGTILL